MQDHAGEDDRYRALLEAAADAIIVVDDAGRIVVANSEAERLFGYPRGELLGQSIDCLVPDRLRSRHAAQRGRYVAAPERRQMGIGRDLTGRRRDGSEFPAEISLSPLRTAEGLLVTTVVRDTTERAMARRAQEVAARRLEAERLARAEAEAASRMKDEFLATVSHELRTPLQAILGWAQLLQRRSMSPELAARALDTIERNARAQVRLIDDLLDVSRIVTGRLHLALRRVEPNGLVAAVLDGFRAAAEGRGVRLEASLDASAGAVLGDPDRLQQVVWNLVANAIKFTPRGGRVDVRTRREAGELRLTVRDDGGGIAPEFLPYVFDRFRQADGGPTRAHGGLGLGLAIVRHLVELHGGTVAAESAGAGTGATFTVALPLAASAPGEEDGGLTAPDAARPPALHGICVLLVDDDPDVRDLLGIALERAGAEVVVASSVAEAFAVLDRQPPTVLVSDIAMPGEDGYTLIRRLRARSPEGGGRVPAIALTAYAGAEDRARALAAGYSSHVGKPVEPERLVATVLRLGAAAVAAP